MILTTFDDIATAYANEDMITLDLETTGFSPWTKKIAVIAMYGPKSGHIGILHYPRGSDVPQEVANWLSTIPEIITHNGTQFDIQFLANVGVNWKAIRWYDTLIGEQSVIAVSRRDVRVNLADTIKRRLGKVINKNIDHGSWANETLDARQMEYLAGDISYLHQLKETQYAKARQDHSGNMLRGLEFEQSLIPAVVQMALNGIPLDYPAFQSYVEATLEHKDAYAQAVHALIGDDVLISSPRQLKNRLNQMFPGMFNRGTASEVLKENKLFPGPMADVCEALLEWRNADTRRKLFNSKWDEEFIYWHEDGPRVHGKFWQLGADTGRFSSSNPNLQQIPKDARHLFRAKPGWAIGKSDYAAIEVRVAASLADDRAMLDAFNQGEDIHRLVASQSFGIPPEEVTREQRQIAKAISFTFLFGGGIEAFRSYVSNNGGTIDRDQAEEVTERFFDRFQGIRDMRMNAEHACKVRTSIAITYPTGLKRMLVGEDLKASTFLNNAVQGTAAAGLKKALKLMEERGWIEYVVAVVHDETLYTAPLDRIEEVRQGVDQCMVDGMKWALSDSEPVAIGVESTWGETWKGDEANTKVTESPMLSSVS